MQPDSRLTPALPCSTRGYTKAVFLYLTFMGILWFVLTAISHKAPDLDGMEELVWASSFELGYLKHPPFPSWVMYGLTHLLGRPVWLSFLAGMLASMASLWFLWLLARELLSERLAFFVILLASLNVYFSLRGTIFNHNTAQLWSIIASIWLFYRACRDQRLRDWAWLGAVAGIALMTKYSAVIQFNAFFIYFLVSGLWRDKRSWQGIAIALLCLLITFSPHLYWLHTHNYAPFSYMDDSLSAPTRWQAYAALLSFTLDQLARLSPMLIAVGILHFYFRKERKTTNQVTTHYPSYGTAIAKRDKQFLLWVGLTPFISTVLIAALLGSHLDASWATTFFVLYSFYCLYGIRGTETLQLKRLIWIAIIIQVVMAASYAIARGPLAWETGRKSRSSFPGPEIAQQMQAVWQAHVPDQPLRLIASDTWLGGNIAVNLDRHAQVYIDAQLAQSPWLNPTTDLECGILVVFSQQTRGEPAASLLALYEQSQWKGQESLPWSSPKSPLIDLNWGIIAPTSNCKTTP